MAASGLSRDSVNLSCDEVVKQVCSCFCTEAAYIYNLKENLKKLERAMEELRRMRDDVQSKVDVEENNGKQRCSKVAGWLSDVESIDSKVKVLMVERTPETQRLCLCGYASKNCLSSHDYGKRVSKGLQEVGNLISDGNFGDDVAMEAPISRVNLRPIEPITGMEPMLEDAWNNLMKDEVGMLGLYGMGGVGKTTLLKQINNKFRETNTFNVVIWVVVVSSNLRAEKIQEEIRKKLKISNERWQELGQDEKAPEIFRVLKSKKFVLLMDDIWQKVPLTEIGVPNPDKENGCKVVFTTRSKEICRRMGGNVKELEVRCLRSDVAMDLFRERVRSEVLQRQDIQELAEIIVDKCCGLPLALNVIGETMASKETSEEWRSAINDLTSSAANFPGMEDKILPILKFSYDNLKKEVKSNFLYCALFPENCRIDKELLVNYWIGEGMLQENTERESVRDEGFRIIHTLVNACLLEAEDKTVKMHNVIREMALWIASGLEEEIENFVVHAGVGLSHMPKVDNWEDVSRMSLMENNISDIRGNPKCPKLLTLILRENKLENISSEFFLSMPKLVVLDLSYNQFLKKLPEEISMLVSLRYLDLSWTNLSQLPTRLKELRQLVYLNLEYTGSLESLDGISDLVNLRTLRLSGSKACRLINWLELRHILEQLTLFTIDVVDAPHLKEFLSTNKLIRCTEHLRIEGVTSTDGISFSMDLGRLRYLEIWDCMISEIKIDRESKRNEIVTSVNGRRKLHNPSSFQNLVSLEIRRCKNLRDLTWLAFAPNIDYLFLDDLPNVKEIIRKEASDTDKQPFGKLRELRCNDLPRLESIYWKPLPFTSLLSISISACPNLKKLPFNSKSAIGNDLSISIPVEELRQFEWEDEETNERFFPALSNSGSMVSWIFSENEESGCQMESANGNHLSKRTPVEELRQFEWGYGGTNERFFSALPNSCSMLSWFPSENEESECQIS